MKYTVKIILIFLIAIALSGCDGNPSSYPFPNSSVSIECVELIHNLNENGEGINENYMSLITKLEGDEIYSFMEEIYELPTKRVGTPPPWGYGTYIAKVIYANGDVEVLGSQNIELIENGSTATGVGSYYFPDDSFVEVFQKYVGYRDK